MIRPIKLSLVAGSLALVAWASFAGGQRLRRVTAGPIQRAGDTASAREVGGIGGGSLVVSRTPDGDDGDPAETFQEVLRYVKSDYVDRVKDDQKLAFGAVRTMLMSLDDPKTRFLEPEQRKALAAQINGEFTGIGAVLTVVKQKKGDIEQRRLGVVAPAPGGPADKAGVRAGDIITEVDGKWVIAYDPRQDLVKLRASDADKDEQAQRDAWKAATKKLTDGISLPKALDTVNAPAGKTLVLTIERRGAPAPLKLSVTTGPTNVEPVEFKSLNDRVAYLRVTQFNDRATEAFKAALTDSKHPALVLDLRDNAGAPITNRQTGSYSSALALLGYLTKGGQVGTLLRKGNVREPIQIPVSSGPARRIAVLIDAGTANLAELVASALKERAGATLIGTTTFGDSAFQKLVDLQDGAGMTITAGKFLTASGKDFSAQGLKPDVALATSGPHSSSDPAVERAVGALAGA